jgi:hypothetical protein
MKLQVFVRPLLCLFVILSVLTSPYAAIAGNADLNGTLSTTNLFVGSAQIGRMSCENLFFVDSTLKNYVPKSQAAYIVRLGTISIRGNSSLTAYTDPETNIFGVSVNDPRVKKDSSVADPSAEELDRKLQAYVSTISLLGAQKLPESEAPTIKLKAFYKDARNNIYPISIYQGVTPPDGVSTLSCPIGDPPDGGHKPGPSLPTDWPTYRSQRFNYVFN